MFEKVLIAERGEAVMRIARTCERMGIATVAMYDATEAGAPYVMACDEAVSIDQLDATSFAADEIVVAAQKLGAKAVHPGSGASRCDAALATNIREAGLTWIGAAPDAIERCATPSATQELARLAGIRALPETVLDPAMDAVQQAREFGYPLWLMASDAASEAIGCETEEELANALEDARRIQNEHPLRLRKWVDRPRLLSVHLASDGRDTVSLGDLEHSLELRGRRLLVESPTPALTGPGGDLKRVALRDAAVRIAMEAAFIGLATAEFMLDSEGQLYFARLRPGLSSEHALTELCTGMDLVELQLRLANGEPLGVPVRRLQSTGHAVEGRVYAEDPLNGTVSHPCEISALRWPAVTPGSLRIETDLAVGSRAAVDRNPLVAKVTGYGRTRHQAVLALDRALAETVIDPLVTNIDCLREILIDESYRAGHYDNGFVEALLIEIKNRK